MTPLISIIIPVYNVEEYLTRCLDSIAEQESSCFEVILVDDGSTDHSAEQCDRFAQEHQNVRVLHKKNEGSGYARNSGLDIAKGEYVFFVDSDDWIPKHTIARLERLIKAYHTDLIEFEYRQTYSRSRFSIKQPEPTEDLLRQPRIMEGYLRGTIGVQPWHRIYRRNLFDHVRFSNVPLHDDAYSMHLFLQNAGDMLVINQICYVQYVRPGSQMQGGFSIHNFISITCGERLLEFTERNYPQYRQLAWEKLLDREWVILCKLVQSGTYCGEFQEQYLNLLERMRFQLQSSEPEQYVRKKIYAKCIDTVTHPKRFVIKQKNKAFRHRLFEFYYRNIKSRIYENN